MDYLEINPEYFKHELTDRFRSPHLWEKKNFGEWELKHKVF